MCDHRADLCAPMCVSGIAFPGRTPGRKRSPRVLAEVVIADCNEAGRGYEIVSRVNVIKNAVIPSTCTSRSSHILTGGKREVREIVYRDFHA